MHRAARKRRREPQNKSSPKAINLDAKGPFDASLSSPAGSAGPRRAARLGYPARWGPAWRGGARRGGARRGVHQVQSGAPGANMWHT